MLYRDPLTAFGEAQSITLSQVATQTDILIVKLSTLNSELEWAKSLFSYPKPTVGATFYNDQFGSAALDDRGYFLYVTTYTDLYSQSGGSGYPNLRFHKLTAQDGTLIMSKGTSSSIKSMSSESSPIQGMIFDSYTQSLFILRSYIYPPTVTNAGLLNLDSNLDKKFSYLASDPTSPTKNDQFIKILTSNIQQNLYVGGNFNKAKFTSSAIGANKQDIFIGKLNSRDGSFVWGQSLYSSDTDCLMDMMLSPFETVLFVAGYSTTSTVCQDLTTQTIKQSFIIQYYLDPYLTQQSSTYTSVQRLSIRVLQAGKISTNQYFYAQLALDSSNYLIMFGQSYNVNEAVTSNRPQYSLMIYKSDMLMQDSDCFSSLSGLYYQDKIISGLSSSNWVADFTYSTTLHSSIKQSDLTNKFVMITYVQVGNYVRYGYCALDIQIPKLPNQYLSVNQQIFSSWTNDLISSEFFCFQGSSFPWTQAFIVNQTILPTNNLSLTFDPVNQLFFGAPYQAGYFEVYLATTIPNYNYLATTYFSILVHNTAPYQIGRLQNITLTVGQYFYYPLNVSQLAEDQELDQITIYAQNVDGSSLSPWLSYTPINSTFSGIPDIIQTLQIQLIFQDTFKSNFTATFWIEVLPGVIQIINKPQDFCGYQGSNISNSVIQLRGIFSSQKTQQLNIQPNYVNQQGASNILIWDRASQTFTFNSLIAFATPFYETVTLEASDQYQSASLTTSFNVVVLSMQPSIDSTIPLCSQDLDILFLDNQNEGVYTLLFRACFKPTVILSTDIQQFTFTLTDGAGNKANESIFSLDQDQAVLYIQAYNFNFGRYWIQIIGTDYCQSQTSLRNRIVINSAPQAKSANFSVQTAYFMQNFIFQIPDDWFTDANIGYGDQLSISVVFNDNSDSWLSFFDTGSTQVFVGTPSLLETDSQQTVSVRATDIYGLYVESFLIIQFQTNKPPILADTSILNFTYLGGQPFYIELIEQFTDPEHNIISHGLLLNQTLDLPDWIRFNPIALSMTGQVPRVIRNTTFIFTLYANDKPSSYTSKQITINILKNNQPIKSQNSIQISLNAFEFSSYQFSNQLFTDTDIVITSLKQNLNNISAEQTLEPINYYLIQQQSLQNKSFPNTTNQLLSLLVDIYDQPQIFNFANSESNALIYYSNNRTLVSYPNQLLENNVKLKFILYAVDQYGENFNNISVEIKFIPYQQQNSMKAFILAIVVFSVAILASIVASIIFAKNLVTKIKSDEQLVFENLMKKNKVQSDHQISKIQSQSYQNQAQNTQEYLNPNEQFNSTQN